jgi:2',3'-cyclic-nucleotide 2'-phosphodiesterase (5'-nucleotidase family)
MRKITIFLVVAVILLAGCGDNNRFRIYYTTSLWGNLDGCTCKSRPRAGLVKRTWFLNQIKDKGGILLLDGGDILSDTRDDLLSPYILDGYKGLGYAAVGVGFNELVNGTDNLLKYRETVPFLSNNISLKAAGSGPLTKEPPIFRKVKFNVGVFSLFDPAVFDDPALVNLKKIPDGLRDELTVTPPGESADACVKNLKNRNADMVVMMYFGYYENAKKLISEVPGIDIVILAFEQKLVDSEQVNNTLVYSPGEEGNRLGMLEISQATDGKFRYGNSFVLFDYFKDADDVAMRNNIFKYETEMRARLKK